MQLRQSPRERAFLNVYIAFFAFAAAHIITNRGQLSKFVNLEKKLFKKILRNVEGEE